MNEQHFRDFARPVPCVWCGQNPRSGADEYCSRACAVAAQEFQVQNLPPPPAYDLPPQMRAPPATQAPPLPRRGVSPNDPLRRARTVGIGVPNPPDARASVYGPPNPRIKFPMPIIIDDRKYAEPLPPSHPARQVPPSALLPPATGGLVPPTLPLRKTRSFAGLGARDVRPNSMVGGPVVHPVTPIYPPPQLVKCRIPECQSPPFRPGAEYCGNSHRKEAVLRGLALACIFCRVYPKSVLYFCGQQCETEVSALAPMILPLALNDPKFDEIAHQFQVKWLHTQKPVPKIRYIYKIVMRKDLQERYYAYRQAVENRGNFQASNLAPGNECRRWHGTRRECTIGDDPNYLALCSSRSCALCMIMRESFKKELTGTVRRKIRIDRFGVGIYASATSSKADDYSSNLNTSQHKAVFLTTVVVGKGKKHVTDEQSYLEAPPGYDSVLGETGNTLNFDEVVVYNNDAIRPSWLVVYKA